ncbi:MAG: T9SS type A sorting domain-containing protein, partial [Candidatus Zixiibacteriota bacterium]
GSTVEIHLKRGGTLLPDTSERVIGLKFEIPDTSSFDTSFTIKFGHNIAAAIKGDSYDCDVTDTTWGSITIGSDPCNNVALEYAHVDSCLQGDTVSVPVLVTNADTLEYLEIWAVCPTGLNYAGANSDNTPWSGSIGDSSSGSTVEIYLERGGTLPPDTSERVIDLKFEIPDTSSSGTSFTIKFGHSIAASRKGAHFDCDVSDTTWGSVTIREDTCSNVALEYADVDTCWPGDTVSVPVLVTNADTLEYLEIWAVCPAGLTYDSLDSEGTPWSGSIADSSSGDTVEIYLERGGTLLPDTSERVIDLKFEISNEYHFGDSFTINFGHIITAAKKDTPYDCEVIDTTWGTVTIPNDTVIVTFSSALAYSYQGADSSDQAKLDNPLKIPVKLFTNYPCSTYKLLVEIPDSLTYVGYDSLDAGVVIYVKNQDSIMVKGAPASRSGGDSTYYLCDLKFMVGDFKSGYNGDQNFCDTLNLDLKKYFPSYAMTEVFAWDSANKTPYDSMTAVSEGIYLPKYEVNLTLVVPDSVDPYGKVEIPVVCSTTFWGQYSNLYIGYNYSYLTYTGVDSMGGHIPSVDIVDFVEIDTIIIENDTSYIAIRQFETADPPDAGTYILPDQKQTLFKIKFDATDLFVNNASTGIKFYTDDWTPPGMFYDFFSPFGYEEKILRNDTMSVWSMDDSEAIWAIPQFSVSVSNPVNHGDTVVSFQVNAVYMSVTDVYECHLGYVNSDISSYGIPKPDSIKPGTWAFSESPVIDSETFTLYFPDSPDSAVNGPGILAYVFIFDRDPGVFEIDDSPAYVMYMDDTTGTYLSDVYSVGAPVGYEWKPPKLTTGLPDVFTLSQNYPNPFNSRTNICFNMPKPGFTELKVFDILGRQITTLVSEELPAGEHIINWDGSNAAGKPIAGGIYFYVLKAGDFRESKKMLYLK